ncbi:MAG: hypothetical protein AB8B87_04035 [Granulosicoccus sp.]
MSRESLPLDHLKGLDVLMFFAGVGLSMSAPASMPYWDRLNELIFNGLCHCYEKDLNKPDFLSQIWASIANEQRLTHYPREYQTQLMHEYFGVEYFRLLQCADVSFAPDSYHSLAQLAKRADNLIANHFGGADLGGKRLQWLLKVQDPGYLLHNGIDLQSAGAGITTTTQSTLKRLAFNEFKPGIGKLRQTTY